MLRGRNGWTKLVGALALAGVMSGCGASAQTAGAPDVFVVPEVVGHDVDEGRTSLTSAGWSVDVERLAIDKVDASKPKPGTVVSQDPAAGAVTSAKSSVHLTVVPDYAVVPDVHTLTRERATQQLTDLGLKVVLHDEPRADAPAGQVTGTNPGSGTLVAPGSSITLSVVSKPIPHNVIVQIYIDVSTGTKRLGNGTCGTAEPTSLLEGTNIVLLGPNDTVIGRSKLSGGTITSATGCQFTGRFENVPQVDSFVLLVGPDITYLPYSLADAKASGFNLFYSYP